MGDARRASPDTLIVHNCLVMERYFPIYGQTLEWGAQDQSLILVGYSWVALFDIRFRRYRYISHLKAPHILRETSYSFARRALLRLDSPYRSSGSLSNGVPNRMLSKGQEASRDIHYACFHRLIGQMAKGGKGWQRCIRSGNSAAVVDVGSALQVMLQRIHKSVSELKQYIDGQVKEGLNAKDYKVINAKRTSPSIRNITSVIINFHSEML